MFSWWERDAQGSASEEIQEGMNQYHRAGRPPMQRFSSVVMQGMATLPPVSPTGCSTAGVFKGQLVETPLPAVLRLQKNRFVSHCKFFVFPSQEKMLQKAGFPCRDAVFPGQMFQLIDSHQPVISVTFLGVLHPCDNFLKHHRRRASHTKLDF